jgi:DNA-binding transcriptional LysR family regulator
MTRAADRLHLAQPALSQAIGQLERQVGVALFKRLARGVEVTEAGEILLDKARQTLQAAGETEAALEAVRRGQEGRLVIAFVATAMIPVLEVLCEFRARYSDVEVATHESDFRSRLAGLRAGRVDAEVVIPVPDAPDLVVEPVSQHEMWLFMSEHHSLAERRQLVFDDIAAERFPGRHPDISPEWSEFWHLDAMRGGPPPLTRECPVTPEETWALIASGKAVCPGPDWLAPARLGPGVVGVPLADVEPLTVGIAARADDARPTVLALLQVVRESGAKNRAKRRVG